MKKETKATIFLAAISLIIVVAALLIKISTTREYISPFSDSFSIFSLFLNKNRPKYTVYGYLPYWSQDKLRHIQLDKLTDISYFGLNINADGTFRKYTDTGELEPGYNNWKNNESLDKFLKFAASNGVRTSLTVISHNDETSDSFLSCGEWCWEKHAKELISQLKEKDMKDVNFNFEYGGFTNPDIADQYTLFVDFMNKRLDSTFGDSKVVVSAFADSFVKPRVTKVKDLAPVSDGIFIMAYDFHRPDSDKAGPVAPIGGAGVHAEYDISTMLTDYLVHVPPEKIILGVPYYGYNWVVTSPQPGATRIPGNDNIGFSQSQTYSYIMETMLEVKPEVKWDALGQVPYFSYLSPNTNSLRQVYFENVDSLRIKYQLAKQLNLSGVGIWALGYDGGYQELWDLINQEFVL